MPIQFDEFVLDLDRYVLMRGERELKLSPKAFEVLKCLAESPGRTLTREELLDAVWPDVVVGEDSLTKAISQVRHALDDRAQEVLKTVRGRGYLLVVPDPTPESATPLAAGPPVATGPRTTGSSGRLRVGAALAVGTLLLAAFGLARPPTPDTAERARWATPALPNSIVVLPYQDLSPSDHAYLADGLTEELIHALTQGGELRVASRTTSFGLRDTVGDAREIGTRLGVRWLVEGSVRVEAGHARVTTQLIRASDGFHVWSGTADRSLANWLGVQDEVAGAVARELRVKLEPSQSERPPVGLQAYLLWLRGRAAWRQRSEASLLQAIQLLEQSSALAPDWAEPRAALADTHADYWNLWTREPRSSAHLDRAEAAARRAVEIDPESGSAHKALGKVVGGRNRNWDGAGRAFERAVALDPYDAEAWESYASHLLKLGRFEESLSAVQRALELAPGSASIARKAGRVHLYRAEYDQAMAYLLRAFELYPDDPDLPGLLSKAYGYSGRQTEAREALLRLWPRSYRPALRVGARVVGLPATIRGVVWLAGLWSESACGRNAWAAAQLLAYVGDVDEMLDCLEEAANRHLWYVRVDPVFDPYRADPRFIAILKAAGYGSG